MRSEREKSVSENELEVVLTDHALRRVTQRFLVRDPSHIPSVLERTVTDGLVSTDDGGDLLIERGCLLMVGDFDGDGTFTVETVYNLSYGISDKLKDRMWSGRPSPWSFSRVVLPQKNRGDRA